LTFTIRLPYADRSLGSGIRQSQLRNPGVAGARPVWVGKSVGGGMPDPIGAREVTIQTRCVVTNSIQGCDLDESDYEEILDLWRRAGLSVRAEGRDSPGAFARQRAWGVQRVAGLREGERLVAVAVLTHDGRKGWINRLAVDPAYRRRGLARRLIAEAERWFAQEVGLEVWAALIERDNTVSQALFGRLEYASHDLVYVSKRTRPEA
jgi:N-acetylglutamate synthase